jgi:hypothetical protein
MATRQKQECDPESPVDQQADNYDLQIPVKSWLRGGVQATEMPNFDHSTPKRPQARPRVFKI